MKVLGIYALRQSSLGEGRDILWYNPRGLNMEGKLDEWKVIVDALCGPDLGLWLGLLDYR